MGSASSRRAAGARVLLWVRVSVGVCHGGGGARPGGSSGREVLEGVIRIQPLPPNAGRPAEPGNDSTSSGSEFPEMFISVSFLQLARP